MRVVRLAVAGILLATAFPVLGAEEAQSVEPVEAIEVAPGKSWDGQQHVGADAKGRVFILRLKQDPYTLLVYPVEGTELGKPRALETASLGAPGLVRDAAMNKHGDWVAILGGEIRWFRSGEEESLPDLRWRLASVEILEGRPIASVFPFRVGRWSKDERVPRPPLVLSANRDNWSTIVSSDLEELPDRKDYVPLRQKYDGELYVDSGDNLWLAHRYRYRITKHSSAGRELLSLELDGAEVRHKEEVDVEDRRVALEEERARYSEPHRKKIATNTAVGAIINLVEGRDDRLYILAHGTGENTGGLVLDRFDPVRVLLERVPVSCTLAGKASLASGKDGLYVVPFNGRRKRFMIPWERLDEAEWLPLEGVVMNGLEVEVASEK